MARGTVEDALNAVLDAEADEVKLRVSELCQHISETTIIERYGLRESSVQKALGETYLARLSVRLEEDINDALWGARISTGI